MNQTKNLSKNYVAAKIIPYLILGISLTIAVAFLILIFYLLVWGIVVGLILWCVMMLKEKFFPSRRGRVIDMEKSASRREGAED